MASTKILRMTWIGSMIESPNPNTVLDTLFVLPSYYKILDRSEPLNMLMLACREHVK